MLNPGTRLAQYEILGLIGAGGMGEVYRARDARLDREVAIKVLPDAMQANADMRGRFEREARAIAALSHPNILAIHELAVIENRPVAVVELVEGETLRARLARGPMPWRDVAQVGARMADGLGAAHAKGIVHRDLKPENVMLTADLRPKILDFGLARSGSWPDVASSDSAATFAPTEPGRVLGTVGYMAPEQVQGGAVSAPADLFALGCTLAEMLTGVRPFARATVGESLAAVLTERFDVAPLLPPDAPPAFAAIIAHCLEKDPADRFQAARDVAAALRALLVDSSADAEMPRRRKSRTRTRSLAVLPFSHSGDSATEYLGDGLTESIINALAQLPKLRVVPRSTVFRYKGRDVDVRSIGLALNAQSLVTGHVTSQGGMLHIQAELIDVATEAQVWGDRFRFPVDELLDAQERIAWQVSEALRMRLTGDEKKRLRKRPTSSTAAFEEYLRGRNHWSRWTHEGFRKAIEAFEAAIALDPSYARAYAGLGDTYGAMGYYGFIPPSLAIPRAMAAARRALELDPTLAEAHTTMGQGCLFFERDWPGAERHFDRAIALDGRYAPAHMFRGLLLVTLGRFDEARRAAGHARDLDPLSPVMQVGVAWVAYFSRRYEDAVEAAKDLLLVEPGFSEANAVLLLAYERQGRFELAASIRDTTGPCFGLCFKGADQLKEGFGRDGARGYWRTRLDQIVAASQTTYVTPYAFAVMHAQLGEADAAFDALARAAEERGGTDVFAAVDPALDPIRDDPRFEAVLRRLNQPMPMLP